MDIASGMASFGECVRWLMVNKLHLSVREYASAANISTNTLNSAFNRSVREGMHPETYRSLAKGAGMTPAELDAALVACAEEVDLAMEMRRAAAQKQQRKGKKRRD